MMKDLLTTYKLGWKTSYYQNTYDFKGAEDNVQPQGLEETQVDNTVNDATITNGHVNGTNGVNGTTGDHISEDDEHCDACAI